MQANAGHLWRVHCNGLLKKQKSERQKAILEVRTQLFGIGLPSGIYNFYLWKLSIDPPKRVSSKVGMLFFSQKNNEYVCVGPHVWYTNGGIL